MDDSPMKLQSPLRKKRKKLNGVEEGGGRGSKGQDEAHVEKKLRGVSNCDDDSNVPGSRVGEEGGEATVRSDIALSDTLSNLSLVRMLQNSKIPRQRKIEVAYKFIKDQGTRMDSTAERGSLNPQVWKADNMAMPQFLSFLSEWTQSAILWSSKPQQLLKFSSVGQEGGVGVRPAHLDHRYWSILAWCISSGEFHLSAASLAPSLLRALDLYVKACAEVGARSPTHGDEDNVVSEDPFRSIEVLLLANQRSFRPDLDHWVSLATTALSGLSSGRSAAFHSLDHFSPLHRLFVHIFEGFARFVTIYPNRKKIFTSLVDNLLESLLLAHASLTSPVQEQTHLGLNDEVKNWQKRVLKAVQEVLEKGLFHSTQISSFQEVCVFLTLKSDVNFEAKGITGGDLRKDDNLPQEDGAKDLHFSYHRVLFRKLDELRKRRVESALTELGWILETYSQSLKTHQAAVALEVFGMNLKGKLHPPASNSSAGKVLDTADAKGSELADNSTMDVQYADKRDQNKEARFRVFAELTGPILSDLRACWFAMKGNLAYEHCLTAKVLLGGFTGLLKAAATGRTYVPTEDSANHSHFTFLSDCFRVVIGFGHILSDLVKGSSSLPSQNADSERQGEHVEGSVDVQNSKGLIVALLRQITRATSYLIDMEYKVAEDFLEDIWVVLMTAAHVGQISAEELRAGKGPVETSDQDAIKVGCQIISVYSDLRQVDRALFTLSATLRKHIQQQLNLSGLDSGSPSMRISEFLVCTSTLRSSVASAVQTLPEGQVAEFIRVLTADSMDSIKEVEESMKFRQESLEPETARNITLGQRSLVELYSCMLENVNITSTNSVLCGKAVSNFMKEVVVPNVCELIDSCLSSKEISDPVISPRDTSKRRKLGKKEKQCRSGLGRGTWHVIFMLRLFMAGRSLHKQCLQMMPPKAVKKANLEMGGYAIDYHKCDIQNIVTQLSAGIYFSPVSRGYVKVSEFLGGLKTKITKHALLDCPSLQYCLDCIAVQSLVELSRHIEAVSYIVVKYGTISSLQGGKQTVGEENGSESLTLDEDARTQKKLQKLFKSLKQESKSLARILLQGLSSVTGTYQEKTGISMTTSSPGSMLLGGNQTASSVEEWKQQTWHSVDATITTGTLVLRRWRLFCQTFDVWARFAADEDLKTFLTCLLSSCKIAQRTHSPTDDQKDGGELTAGVNYMQLSTNELLSNALFFEEESIRRLFPSTFLETLNSLIRSAFGDEYISESSLEKETSAWSDLVELQVGQLCEEQDSGKASKSPGKSISKTGRKWTSTMCATDLKALGDCVALVNQLLLLPPGYMKFSEATRSTYVLQSLERLAMQSLLHKRLSSVNMQPGNKGTDTVGCSTGIQLIEVLCACRKALLALSTTGIESSDDSKCSTVTVLSRSLASLKWLSQSLNAAATCLVDVVEFSSLPQVEKVSKLSMGEDLLHNALKCTASLFTYICEESSKLEARGVDASIKAVVSSQDKEDPLKLAAHGNGEVKAEHMSNLHELLESQATGLDRLVQKVFKRRQNLQSAGPKLAQSACREDLKSWYGGLALTTSLCSYFWSFVSSVGDTAKATPVIGTKSISPPALGRNVETLGEKVTRTLISALVPDDSHAMLLVGEQEVHGNLKCSLEEAITVPPQHEDTELDKGEEEGSDGEDNHTDSSIMKETTMVDMEGVQEEEEEDEELKDVMQDVLDIRNEDQDKVASGIDLVAAEYSNRSSPQRTALELLLECSCRGMCDLIGELYLTAAGFLKLETSSLLRNKESYKLTGHLSPGGNVLLGAGYWILLKAAEKIRSGSSAQFGWLVGVVKYMESTGYLLACIKSPLSPSAFNKLFNMHIYFLGSLSQGENEVFGHPMFQSLNAMDRLETSLRVGSYRDGMTTEEMKGGSDYVLREAVRSSLGVLMRTAPRHHSVLALQAITRALVGASEDASLTSGLELCGHDSGEVARGVAAGVQSLSLVLEAVSGTKRLRLLANHFKEFSGAILNLIESLAGPRLFYSHEVPLFDISSKMVGRNSARSMVPSGPVILQCLQIMTSVASRESIYPLKACHVALALHCPARIFSPFLQSGLSKFKVSQSYLAFEQSRKGQEKQVFATKLRISNDLGVKLYVACCRLLCSVIRHRRRESGHCIALVGDSARVLLHCLEASNWSTSGEDTQACSTQMATYCATWLRRIYEEMGEHKETLGKYCCHILSDYLSVLAGHGPNSVGLTREVEGALRPGAYVLVDACTANDLQQLHASLGEGPRRNALLELRRQYTQRFKYTGKV